MQNDKMDAKAERQEFAKRQEFERLVRENQSGLLAFLLSLTGNLPDSEDLVQECVTLLLHKFDDFESGSKVQVEWIWDERVRLVNLLSLD